ncbi:hypothetical protein [Haliscomenobacter sp.]|uniref:hypothetical protein n=1 Tax=Haliscomenobacter sp. TaxID=2717303 RepID=UPI0035932606
MVASINDAGVKSPKIEVSTRLGEYDLERNTELFAGSTVFAGAPSRTKMRNTWSKLLGFKNLKKDWDSYGAAAPDLNAINNAIEFVNKAYELNLPIYFVAPGVNGEVMIEFKAGDDKAAEIYFNPDNSTEMLLFVGDDGFFEGTLDKDLNQLIDFMHN